MPESITGSGSSNEVRVDRPPKILWSVYMVRCGDDSFYTGIATDVARRLSEHEAGVIGSKYLRGRGPLELVFEHQVGDRSLASKIEHRIKKLSRCEKANLEDLPVKVGQMILDCSTPQ